MGLTAAVILAAGQGTRMRSRRMKVLHEVGGLPLLEHVLRTVARLDVSPVVVVVGVQAEAVTALVASRAQIVLQPEMRGTGDAVRRALSRLPDAVDRVLVLYGDCPLVPHALLTTLLQQAEAREAAVLITAEMPDPSGYGRIVRGPDGTVAKIVEDKEASDAIRQIHEINSGIGVWPREALETVLTALPAHGQEFYLTDAVAELMGRGIPVTALVAPGPSQVMGINTRQDLAQAESALRQETLARLMDAGVTILDPPTTFIDAGVVVGTDSVIYPMTVLKGRTVVGEHVRIGPMATVQDSQIGDHAIIGQAVVEHSYVGPHCDVGPFSHLRAESYLERDVHVGNFAELKHARVGIGSKMGHHCYLGDVTMGAHVNIGAGTVIVNYDGVAKHPTFIGDDAFIGCNANLVAPVEIGPGAYIAAGSTVTHNVPGDALAIARARQENKAEWAVRRRQTRPPSPS